MSSKSSASSGGVSFLGLLTIVFITLKLIKIISWPWLWVLAPFWMPVAILIAIVLIAILLKLLLAMRHDQ